MFCIGLTGSVASGKSTVAQHFSQLGIDVISADQLSRALVGRDEPALQKIIDHFGQSILTTNGDLNRPLLRELMVKNDEERCWLESLLHPLIREKIQQGIHHCKSPYCIIEIPLLTDTSNYPYLNRILLVLADPEQQIVRIQSRDHCSHEQACALLATTQADNNKRLSIADDVLVNDKSIDELKRQVEVLHTSYLYFARSIDKAKASKMNGARRRAAD